jgi:hypothetical protein
VDRGNKKMQAGLKDDAEKLDWTLLPIGPIKKVIQVLTFGANKYKRDQWQQVPDAKRRYLAAAFRHLSAISEGELLDSESNLPHAAHCAACCLFLIFFGNRV